MKKGIIKEIQLFVGRGGLREHLENAPLSDTARQMIIDIVLAKVERAPVQQTTGASTPSRHTCDNCGHDIPVDAMICRCGYKL